MIGIIVLTLLAFLLSLVLVFVEQKVSTKDKQQKKFCELLPGYNCGACGYGSCDGMAASMLEDINNYKKCKPLKGEALEKLEDYVSKSKN